jgi:thymidylate synthase
MNDLDKQYQNLLADILISGRNKEDRTGTGTRSVFGRQIRHDMRDGFPLLTTKKMAWKTMVTELLWFLRGDTNIQYLVQNGCHIWDGDAYKNYCNQIPEYSKQFTMSKEEYIYKIKTDDEFAERYGELGPIYGKQWRSWNFPEVNGYFGPIDQVKILIQSLKTNPDSRRLIVNAWNVGELHQMILPPCHYGFQVYTRELSLEERIDIHNIGSISKSSDFYHEHMDINEVPRRAISLMWNQRSVDTFLGLPFNIASYGLLLMMIADEVNMVPEELIGNLGDVHLYLDHIEQAKEQMNREPFELPNVVMRKACSILGKREYTVIKAPLSN